MSHYNQQISQALDETLRRVDAKRPFHLSQDRFIILSDQHRGARNRADDFRVAERAYNATLAYYYHQGYTLVVLGDVEELWEEHPAAVIEAYAYSLSLEAQFHQAGRYLRFWGNHDDDWADAGNVKKYLEPLFGSPVTVYESMLLQVMDGDAQLGEILLLHGHQGTSASDKYSPLSRWLVRNFWRQIQRLTGRSLNTPAHNWELRDQHNIALYSWVARQENMLLIAGHTHRPVFESRSHPDQLQISLEKLHQQLEAEPQNSDLIHKISLTAAELEWVRAQESDSVGAEGRSLRMSKPCYFNTGCCSFSDGDITGIELAEGEIRLMRLPNHDDRPQPQILERASLKNVLRRSTTLGV